MTPLPRYPIYIPSRGRPSTALTAMNLLRDGVPFNICVAPQEVEEYRKHFADAVLPLPSDSMDIVAVRNWIRDHAEEAGAQKHWQLDDNIRAFVRRWHAIRFYCDAGIVLRIAEDFTDRYTNIGISGLEYAMFCPDTVNRPPFVLNIKVYSCSLINHEMPYRWRGPYNDDTDLCLQALSGGWCTVSFNALLQYKIPTMRMKGGMNDSNANNYQGDGRLKMARTLERRWPGVVDTKRRFRRPQHVVRNGWRGFDTPLLLRPGLTLEGLHAQANAHGTNEYGMRLVEVAEVASDELRSLVEEYNTRFNSEARVGASP